MFRKYSSLLIFKYHKPNTKEMVWGKGYRQRKGLNRMKISSEKSQSHEQQNESRGFETRQDVS